jgi:[protein-PII] uridylyltransferase
MTQDVRNPNLAEFLNSMPAAYAHVFSPSEVCEHARIVGARGDRPVHVGLWRILPSGLTVLCVVADDRPGLMSRVSAAFVAHRVDVSSAQIYCRKLGRVVVEAVDFFWVRSTDAEGTRRVVGWSLVSSLERMLSELIKNERRSPSPQDWPASVDASHAEPKVFFDNDALKSERCVLVVETRDRPGLLLSITLALHQQKVEIVTSEIRTEGELAHDRFTLTERGQSSLSPDRLGGVRDAVFNAIRPRGVAR